jgi:hypothetical protein
LLSGAITGLLCVSVPGRNELRPIANGSSRITIA